MLEHFLAGITQARTVMAARLTAFGVASVAQVSIGFVVALTAVPLIATAHSWLALPALLFGLILSAIGRANASAQVAASSIAFDVIVLAAVPFAFALADPTRALAAVFVLFAMVAAGAAALLANDERKLTPVDEAVCASAFALACMFPTWFGLIAYVLGLLGFIAAGSRFALALVRNGA
ncbi:MAG TPA: hypothetical protein VHE09_01160 [Rhizomicrobium sp.]|jgi:hypothetical protein|nr:hypothetical protein [Rhizomicrobium sp.]